MAALSLAVDFDTTKLALLATLALADAVATPYLFVTLRLWPYPRRALACASRLLRPCRRRRPVTARGTSTAFESIEPPRLGRVQSAELGGEGIELSSIATHTAPSDKEADAPLARDVAIAHGYIRLLDMLDCVMLASEDEAATHVLTRQEMRDVCRRVRAEAHRMPPELRARLEAPLAAYLPSADGRAEAALLARMRDPSAAPLPPSVTEEERRAKLPRAWQSNDYRHPLRSTQLSYVLQGELWASRPSIGGRTRTHSGYGLSEPAERVDYFVSHASPDARARKVAILREFLCLQSLVGRTFVVMPMLALFLLPLGLGLAESAAALGWSVRLPPYALSCVPLALLAGVVLWVLSARLGLLPSRATPWALAPVTVWLDACCLCQETPETIDAGVDALASLLERSDRMVALVSEA